MENLKQILYVFGGFATLVGVAMIAFQLILSGNSDKKRTEAMAAFPYIIIGSFITGAAALIAGYIHGLNQDVLSGLSISGGAFTTPNALPSVTDDPGNFFVRAITLPINLLVTLLQGILTTTTDFKTINELVFNLNAQTPYAPFTPAEWVRINYVYKLVGSITGGLVLIAIVKTGVSYIFGANSSAKRTALKEEIPRWIAAVFALGLAPFFVEALIIFTNDMVAGLYNLSKPFISPGSILAIETDFIQRLNTGSVFTTAIAKFLFLYVELNINLIFYARKIIMIVMYEFTPIAILLWCINKNVLAAQVWFGEMITNTTMPFFYSFTLFAFITASLGSLTNWFLALIWLFMLTSIAEMLRNSLQGIFAMLAGLNEQAASQKALTTVGRMIGGARTAFTQSSKPISAQGVMNQVYGNIRPYTTSSGGSSQSQGKSESRQPAFAGINKTPSSNGFGGFNTGGSDSNSQNSGSISGFSDFNTGGSASSSGLGGFDTSGSTSNSQDRNSSSGFAGSNLGSNFSSMGNSSSTGNNGFSSTSSRHSSPKQSQSNAITPIGNHSIQQQNGLGSSWGNGDTQSQDNEYKTNYGLGNGVYAMANDSEGQPHILNDNPEIANESARSWATQDKYNGMLYNNLRRHQNKDKDYGNLVGRAANNMIGHDKGFAMIANGAGNMVGRVQRTVQAGRAIKDTMKQVKADYQRETGRSISDKEAMKQIFGNREIQGINVNQVRFMNSFGKTGAEGSDRVLMQSHGYTNANGFTWKN
jgi:hypothetical protein